MQFRAPFRQASPGRVSQSSATEGGEGLKPIKRGPHSFLFLIVHRLCKLQGPSSFAALVGLFLLVATAALVSLLSPTPQLSFF